MRPSSVLSPSEGRRKAWLTPFQATQLVPSHRVVRRPHGWFRPIELYAGADRFLQVNAGGTKATIRIKGLPAMRLRLHRPLPEGQPLVIRITRTPRRVVASLVYVHVDPQPAEAATERRWASMLALQSASPCLTTAATSTDASWTGASSVAYSAAWHEQSADPPDVARKSRRWLESGSASPSTTVVTSTKWPRPLMRQANARARDITCTRGWRDGYRTRHPAARNLAIAGQPVQEQRNP